MAANASYKPIPTLYNGLIFRSRLEARWAVFFDTAGIRYIYEPYGFEFEDGTKYLPDFYLPDVYGRGGRGVWAEVKGIMDSKDNHKCECLARAEGINNVAVLFECDEQDYDCEMMWLDGDGELCWDNNGHFFRCPDCGAITYEFDNNENRCLNPKCHTKRQDWQLLEKAYRTARRARFEFGETPRGI